MSMDLSCNIKAWIADAGIENYTELHKVIVIALI